MAKKTFKKKFGNLIKGHKIAKNEFFFLNPKKSRKFNTKQEKMAKYKTKTGEKSSKNPITKRTKSCRISSYKTGKKFQNIQKTDKNIAKNKEGHKNEE